MAQNTWNFPCWQPVDFPVGGGSTRGISGQSFECGGGSQEGSAFSYPFTEEITLVFSFLARTGWTADGGTDQFIHSMGGRTAPKYNIWVVMDSAGDSKLHYEVYDATGFPANTMRYEGTIGDEDGTNWLSFDKWYQCIMVINNSGFSISVNGTASPKHVVTTNTPGVLNFDIFSELTALWVHAGAAEDKDVLGGIPSGKLPSLVFGPGGMLDGSLDLTSSAVLDRFYDANNDWNQPGEDGSLWLGDTYGSVQWDHFFMDGSARFNPSSKGTMTLKTNEAAEGKAGPGGLRKQYES